MHIPTNDIVSGTEGLYNSLISVGAETLDDNLKAYEVLVTLDAQCIGG